MPRSRDVFVQSRQPVYTYVERAFYDPRIKDYRDPELDIARLLGRDGPMIQLVGPSKSGKTVTMARVFKDSELVKIGGSQVTSPDRLWQLVCASLNVRVARTISTSSGTTKETKKQVSGEANLFAAKFGVDVASSVGDQTGASKGSELLDDYFSLATEALVIFKKVLFVDDFHVVPSDQKRSVVATLKQAMEKGVKICLAEVPAHADEPVDYLRDVVGRVARVDFGYWRQEDLREIARLGFQKLNVTIPASAITALALESGGSPQLMQLLCLGLCERFKIGATKGQNQKVNVDLGDVNYICIEALQSISANTPLLTIEKGSTVDRTRRHTWQARNGKSYDMYELCIAAIVSNPPATEITFDAGTASVLKRIYGILGSMLGNNEVEKTQETLVDIASSAAKVNPSLPFLHFDRLKGVSIQDPYTYFYIRWEPKYFELREMA